MNRQQEEALVEIAGLQPLVDRESKFVAERFPGKFVILIIGKQIDKPEGGSEIAFLCSGGRNVSLRASIDTMKSAIESFEIMDAEQPR